MIVASPQLLVSVRGAAEAEVALAGGADVIDVKEPLHGALGRADDTVISEVIACVGGRRPVSAALGELAHRAEAVPYRQPGLAFTKWGLAGMGQATNWAQRLAEAEQHVRLATPWCRTVAVAYADWHAAAAPSVEAIVEYVQQRPGGILLLDTFQKASDQKTRATPTLLDLIPLRQLADLCAGCRAAGVRVALAGSLRAEHIRELKEVCPDWFAVRGAACDDGRREAAISAHKVRALADLLR